MGRNTIANADLFTTTTGREQVGYLANSREATVVHHVTPCNRHRAFILVGQDTYITACPRCGGSGRFESGLDSNRCWNCGTTGMKGAIMPGTKMQSLTRAWALAKRRDEEKRVAAARVAELDRQIWRGAHAELITWAESLVPTETYPGSEWEGEYHVFGLYRHGDPLVNTLRSGGKLDHRDAEFLNGVRERHIADAAAAMVSRHAGEVGDKLTITGVVRTAREVEQCFGYRTTYTNFIVVEGTGEHAGITWTMFTAAAGFGRLERGEAVTVTATIKELSEYKGAKQDKVNRPKLG